MADYSPTGYWAHISTLLPESTEGPTTTYVKRRVFSLPIVGWDQNGDALVVGDDGRRRALKGFIPPGGALATTCEVTPSPKWGPAGE